MLKRLGEPTVVPENRSTLVRVEEQVLSHFEGLETVVLEIRFGGKCLPARELAAYLTLLDGAFGRTDPRGFRSYSLRRDHHLQIANITPGSTVLEIVLGELQNVELWRLILTYLVLRTGPSILKGEAAKNWAESAKALGEAALVWSDITERVSGSRERVRLTRRQRAGIRGVLESDPLLKALTRRDIDVLVRMVEGVLIQENSHLPAAARFADKHILDIALRVRREDGE